MLLLLLILVPLGTFFLVRGLRGRVVSDHPFCRACGFDLFGLPAQSSRCSECGASLDPPRAVRQGRRERRWPLILIGSVPLTLLACLLIGLAIATAQNVNPQ